MRTFLPTWFATAGILAFQMATVVVAPEPDSPRAFEWNLAATLLAAWVVTVGTASWAFPRVRAMSWLIGALGVSLLGLWQAGQTPPPSGDEQFSIYTIGAILLAIGAWFQARSHV